MITREQAREVATAVINDGYNVEGDRLEVLDDLTIEKEYGWIFFYDSRRHLETGNYRDLLAGNGPVLVQKSDGSVRRFGSAHPVDHYIAEYERGLTRQG